MPNFSGPTKRLHWSFPDPSKVTGTHAEKMAAVRRIRDEIRARIESWCDEICAPGRRIDGRSSSPPRVDR